MWERAAGIKDAPGERCKSGFAGTGTAVALSTHRLSVSPVVVWVGAMVALRVLVVDDNRDAADSLSELLAAWGAEVRTCYDAAEALALVASFAPDAAVLDVQMPVTDGCALAGLLRAAVGSRPLLLIALTGVSDAAACARTAAAGFDRHLTKSIPPEEIVAALGLRRPDP